MEIPKAKGEILEVKLKSILESYGLSDELVKSYIRCHSAGFESQEPATRAQMRQQLMSDVVEAEFWAWVEDTSK